MKRRCLKKEEELEGESLEKRENAIGTERDGVSKSRGTVLWPVWKRMKNPSFGLLSICHCGPGFI
jgi:hypothetical protein